MMKIRYKNQDGEKTLSFATTDEVNHFIGAQEFEYEAVTETMFWRLRYLTGEEFKWDDGTALTPSEWVSAVKTILSKI